MVADADALMGLACPVLADCKVGGGRAVAGTLAVKTAVAFNGIASVLRVIVADPAVASVLTGACTCATPSLLFMLAVAAVDTRGLAGGLSTVT